jgi:hypothetical protein
VRYAKNAAAEANRLMRVKGVCDINLHSLCVGEQPIRQATLWRGFHQICGYAQAKTRQSKVTTSDTDSPITQYVDENFLLKSL